MGACVSSTAVQSVTEVDVGQGAAVSRRGRYTTERQIWKDYVVHQNKILGTGMNGAVKLAVGKVDNCLYAVKSFPKDCLSKRARRDLKNEANVYLSLDHPHVAQLEMVYETEKELHLVMEHMSGGELFDRVKVQGGFCEGSAAQATHQMLLAVSYIHKRGIVHRDLKLENFLYEKKGSDHLKLIDFGLAKFVTPDERMSLNCGSNHYIAPEVLNHSYTQKADLWSLGVVVYVMLTGQVLFNGTHSEVRAKTREGKCDYGPRFSKLSLLAKDFVQSLLVVDPEKRMAPRQALSHPWLQRRELTKKKSLGRSLPCLLTNIRRYARASPCERSVFLMMAWSLSMEDRARLRKHFMALDLEGTGFISLQEFKAALEDKFALQDKQEAEALFKTLDANGDNRIEYREFLAAAMSAETKFQEATLKRAFAHFDGNGDGLVSRGELINVLGGSCANRDIEQFFENADASGNGWLSYSEFQASIKKAELDTHGFHL